MRRHFSVYLNHGEPEAHFAYAVEIVTKKSTVKCGQAWAHQCRKKKVDKCIYRCIRVYRFRKGGRMITKVRTNIFLTRVQQKKLRALSKRTGAPIAALVRIAIDNYLGKKRKIS